MTQQPSTLSLDLYPWQQDQWQQVSHMMQQQRLPHALIIGGVPGLGKLTFATHLAAALLCQQQLDGHACGQCKSCQLLAANSHPDYNYCNLKRRVNLFWLIRFVIFNTLWQPPRNKVVPV